ncbi:unnamed protein product [Lactuca saligna]|uniref:DUF4005 domain-containing protein n=1 Tax=Lactuca saligna TaxID=75948 RepID=A0AA36DZR3_LACSI|nr:unnamed protein product [Lactuca saligna]
MGKSPGKWIKTKLFGKKSSKSNLSKDAILEKKTSITSKATSKDLDDDSMVISSPVPLVMHVSEEHTEVEKTSSVNLMNSTSEVARSTTVLNTENGDESIRLEQAAIKAQAAFRGYLARRTFLSLKGIILLQAHIRGHLARKQLQPKVRTPNIEGNLVISTETEKPKPTLRKVSTQQPESLPEQSHSELEKVKQSLRKISISMAAASGQGPPPPPPEPESEPKPEPEQGPDEPEPEIEPKSKPEPEPEPEPELRVNLESNGKEHLKTKRRKSLPAKQEHVECVLQNTPVLPSYMAATESAKAKLRAQTVAEDGGDNGFIRRHSLPSSTGKLSLQSPRVQKPLQANGKGWIKSNKAQICAKDDKMMQTGWKR